MMKIETKLTRHGDPAVDAESMNDEFRDAELSLAETMEALASAGDLEAKVASAFGAESSDPANQEEQGRGTPGNPRNI